MQMCRAEIDRCGRADTGAHKLTMAGVYFVLLSVDNV